MRREAGRPRIIAYLLAGDVWWIEDSVHSYYGSVDRIVVSYDRQGLSWGGVPLPVDECLERLRAIDVEGKLDFRPGDFARPGRSAIESETHQRQVALDQASVAADWVLQLDTDEVVTDPAELRAALEEADRRGAGAVEFPARFLYARGRDGRFLEAARSLWRRRSAFPGPIAVRAGTTLVHNRQAAAPLYRLDVSPRNADPSHPPDAIVHRTIRGDQAILHYSWIRSDDYMVRKAAWSGHSDTYTRMLRSWRRRTRHPVLAVLFGWLLPDGEWHRLVRLPPDRRRWRGEP